MARKGLPKKYAKMGFKRGWAAYKRTKRAPARARRRSYAAPVRRRSRPMARKRSYRRKAKNFLTSKTAIDGYLSVGGKFVIRKVIGGSPIFEAGLDVLLGAFRHNNTLLAQGIGNGLTAFLPSLNLGGGMNNNGGYI